MVTKVAVYIGRFQTFHNGHAHTIERALEKYDALVILIGSCGKARDVKNPFTGTEREQLINYWRHEQSIYEKSPKFSKPTLIRQIKDYPYSDSRWIEAVQKRVDNAIIAMDIEDAEVTLVGSERDQSTWYLRSFPQWKTDFVEPYGEQLSATVLRFAMYDELASPSLRSIMENVPRETGLFISRFVKTEAFKQLQQEYYFLKKSKEAWSTAPYPPTFLTVDACVIQSGHVLVIQRRAEPGKGLWALPGGYLNQEERLLEGSIRELVEETKIKVTPNILKGSLRGKEIFDHPDRSLRGRIVTTTFLYKLDDSKALPAVKGSDDAVKAFWLPISEALTKTDMWFEDHLDMLETMLGMLKD